MLHQDVCTEHIKTIVLVHWGPEIPGSPTFSCLSSQGCTDQPSPQSHAAEEILRCHRRQSLPLSLSLLLRGTRVISIQNLKGRPMEKALHPTGIVCMPPACPCVLRRALPTPLPTSPTRRNSSLLSPTHVPSQEKPDLLLYKSPYKKEVILDFYQVPFCPVVGS